MKGTGAPVELLTRCVYLNFWLWNHGTSAPAGYETVEPAHQQVMKPWNQCTSRLWNHGTSASAGYETMEPVHQPVMKPWNQCTSRLWNRGTNTPAVCGTSTPAGYETVELVHQPFVEPWNQYTSRLWNRGTSTAVCGTVEPVHQPVMKPWNQYTSRLWNHYTFTVNSHNEIFKIGVPCHVSSQVLAGRCTLCEATHRWLSFVMVMADGKNKLWLRATATLLERVTPKSR